jgi:hypothetical protein
MSPTSSQARNQREAGKQSLWRHLRRSFFRREREAREIPQIGSQGVDTESARGKVHPSIVGRVCDKQSEYCCGDFHDAVHFGALLSALACKIRAAVCSPEEDLETWELEHMTQELLLGNRGKNI